MCTNRHRLCEAWSQRCREKGRHSVQGMGFRSIQPCGPKSCLPPPPPMHMMHTTKGLYSLICLSAVQPTATEPKCSTFWKPSTSWSSGCFCFMFTSSWAHLAMAEMGWHLGKNPPGPLWPQPNSPLKKEGVPRETLAYDSEEGKEKAKPGLGGGQEAG